MEGERHILRASIRNVQTRAEGVEGEMERIELWRGGW